MLVKHCDLCGSTKDAKTVWFTLGREMDGAGSMDDVMQGFDLCGPCGIASFQQVLKSTPYGGQEVVYNKMMMAATKK